MIVRWIPVVLVIAVVAVGCASDDTGAPAVVPDLGGADTGVDTGGAADVADAAPDAGGDVASGDSVSDVGAADVPGGADADIADTTSDAVDTTPDADAELDAEDTGAPDTGAPDAGAPDAGDPDAGDPDAGAVQCGVGPSSFPSFAVPCTSDDECLIREHQVDCCGTLVATGVSVDNEQAFLAAEALCQSQYPGCGCASQPTVADDGYPVESLDRVIAICESGACFTYSLDVPPKPTDAIEEWLAFGAYKAWEAESAPHASTGPHFGMVRTFVNPILAASLAQGSATHPLGAAAVKELYGAGDTVLGHAVLSKTGASEGGKGFRWYEKYDGTLYADDNGVALCTGCHLTGTDFVKTPWPLQ